MAGGAVHQHALVALELDALDVVVGVRTGELGVVAVFAVSQAGSFSFQPTSFTQSATSGNGAGFTLGAPTFGPSTLLTQIQLPFSGGPVSAAYQDGFGVVNDAGTNQWWQSDLDDLSIWEPLNFSSADAAIGSIVGQVMKLSRGKANPALVNKLIKEAVSA